MRLRAVATLVLMLAAPAPADGAAEEAAEGPRLSVEADRIAATVGDPIELTVRLIVPPGGTVRSFEPGEVLSALTVLDRGEVPLRVREDGQGELVRWFRIAAYDLDDIVVPALEAIVVDAEGGESTVASAPLRIAIASVLAEGEIEPADIKPPAVMPVAPIWPWLAIALLLLAAALWWLWRRRDRPEETAAAPAAPPRPAHEVAYAELEHLLSSGLLERGGVKEFYIELAEILRRYLEARFGIDTFERTTNEILEALRGRQVSVRVKARAAEFFLACDMVKFAKHLPDAEETRSTVDRAYQIIDETKREAPPASAAAAAVPSGPAAAGSAS